MAVPQPLTDEFGPVDNTVYSHSAIPASSDYFKSGHVSSDKEEKYYQHAAEISEELREELEGVWKKKGSIDLEKVRERIAAIGEDITRREGERGGDEAGAAGESGSGARRDGAGNKARPIGASAAVIIDEQDLEGRLNSFGSYL